MNGKMGCIYQKLKIVVEDIFGFLRVLLTICFLQYPSIGISLILAIMMLIFKDEVTVSVAMFYEEWVNGR